MAASPLKFTAMKYRKLIAKYFAEKSINNAQIVIAIVAGLATGAIISILFAPDSGTGTRGKIAKKAKDFRYGFQDKYNTLREKVFGPEVAEEDIVEQEVPNFKHNVSKKRKSDAQDLKEGVLQNREMQEEQS